MNVITNNEDKDFAKSSRPAANVGKRFYTWATLGTFAGACFLVNGIWAICKRLNDSYFAGEEWPLLFSVVILVFFAFATEPTKEEKGNKTNGSDIFQKGLVTIGNILLVFFSVIGASTIIPQIINNTGG